MSRCVTVGRTIEAAARRAIASLDGGALVRAALRARPCRARRVIAVGKAACAMAAGAADAIGDELTGIVVDKAAAPLPPGLALHLGGHPRPDARSEAATRAALAFAAADEALLVLVSGGTSALLGGPIDGVTVEAFGALTDAMMRDGRPIADLNRVRRRLGAALGGRLGAASRAAIRALVVSDVAGDDPRVIGSGPLSAPPLDDVEAALAAAAAVGAAPSLLAALRDASPSPAALRDRLADRVELSILAGPEALADAVAVELGAAGLRARAAPALVDGPVEQLAARLTDEAAALAPGEAFVAVGEPTVQVRGAGRGGRAQHCALLLVAPLAALGDRAAIALASDGSDGPTDAAGGLVTSETAARAGDLRAALAAFDSHAALARAGALVRTGPTGTNLTDLYVVARSP